MPAAAGMRFLMPCLTIADMASAVDFVLRGTDGHLFSSPSVLR
jgi:hypothetical protein